MSVTTRDRRLTYREVKPKRFSRKDAILEVLLTGDPEGMTADEIGERLVLEGKISDNSPNYTRPRLTELRAEGRVKVVNRRRGNSGCNMAVWKAVQ